MLLPTGALPKLFPTVSFPSTLSSLPYRSFPPELSPRYYFPWHGTPLPSTLSSLPYRFFPPELPPNYFTLFPFRPPSHHSRRAPFHRSSPQAISHGFPSVHPVVIPVSLLPTGAFPKLFPTVSLPSTLSSFPYRSFPPELSPSYFPRSPQAISHGFPSVHPVVTLASFPLEVSPSVHPVLPVSLLPTGALPKLFPTCRHSRRAPFPGALPKLFPTTLSSSLLPTGAQAISHGFPSVHPVSFPPSHRSFPQAPTVPSVHPVVNRSFPQELSPSYFPRFPFRPPVVAWLLPTGGISPPSPIAPSHRSSSTVFFRSSCRHSRSFPPELSPSYFPRFPSPRSSPQAISHCFPPVPSRSFPTELSPCYFLRFPLRSLPIGKRN